MSDTLFADVSEFQPPVDSSYPYRWLSIRSNDGTYRDHNFAANYAAAQRMLDSGKLRGLIVYAVCRPNWQDSLHTHLEMLGRDRPDVVSMVDAESWGGQIVGDHSGAFNGFVWGASDFHGGGKERPHRVVGYLNPNDASIWPTRPPIPFVVPSYGAPPRFTAATADVGRMMFAHQYTDGQGYGHGLPEGASPFGHCDMNAANGRDPEQLRSLLLGAAGQSAKGGTVALTRDQDKRLFDVWFQAGKGIPVRQVIQKAFYNVREGVLWPRAGLADVWNETVWDGFENPLDTLDAVPPRQGSLVTFALTAYREAALANRRAAAIIDALERSGTHVDHTGLHLPGDRP